eukprot:PhM_4_TR15311/c0_g2_i1/m.31533/K06889/K06889; uncharacterized protein
MSQAIKEWWQNISAVGLVALFPAHLRLIEIALNMIKAPTWSYSALCHASMCACIGMYRRNSTGWSVLLVIHAALSALALSRLSPDVSLPMQPWLAIPMATSMATLAVTHFSKPNTAAEANAMLPSIFLWLHVARFVLSAGRTMIFPARIISAIVDLESMQREMVAQGWEKLRITSAYGCGLDAAVLRHADRKRWLVWFGGNGEMAEASWETAQVYCQQLNANGVVFNYRGIGRSEGRASTAADLVADGAAVLRHVHDKYNAPYDDIILFGHSLGGGIALQLSVEHTGSKSLVINDRSFSSLLDAVYAIGQNIVPLPRGAFEVILPHLFGDLPSYKYWDVLPDEKKVIVYHRGDNVLPYKLCSLHHMLTTRPGSKGQELVNCVELTEMTSDPHNVATMHFSGHRKLIEIARSLLNK